MNFKILYAFISLAINTLWWFSIRVVTSLAIDTGIHSGKDTPQSLK